MLLLTSEYVVGVDSSASGHERTVLLTGTVEQITVFTAGLFHWLIHHQITLHTCEKHHTFMKLFHVTAGLNIHTLPGFTSSEQQVRMQSFSDGFS